MRFRTGCLIRYARNPASPAHIRARRKGNLQGVRAASMGMAALGHSTLRTDRTECLHSRCYHNRSDRLRPTAVIREPATDDRSGAKRTTSRRTGNPVFGRLRAECGVQAREAVQAAWEIACISLGIVRPSVPGTKHHPCYATLILGPADGLTPSTRKGSDYAKRAAAPASASR